MTVAVGVHHLFCGQLALFGIVEFELLGVSKVLKNRSIVIGYCNSHIVFSFRYYMIGSLAVESVMTPANL